MSFEDNAGRERADDEVIKCLSRDGVVNADRLDGNIQRKRLRFVVAFVEIGDFVGMSPSLCRSIYKAGVTGESEECTVAVRRTRWDSGGRYRGSQDGPVRVFRSLFLEPQEQQV